MFPYVCSRLLCLSFLVKFPEVVLCLPIVCQQLLPFLEETYISFVLVFGNEELPFIKFLAVSVARGPATSRFRQGRPPLAGLRRLQAF